MEIFGNRLKSNHIFRSCTNSGAVKSILSLSSLPSTLHPSAFPQWMDTEMFLLKIWSAKQGFLLTVKNTWILFVSEIKHRTEQTQTFQLLSRSHGPARAIKGSEDAKSTTNVEIYWTALHGGGWVAEGSSVANDQQFPGVGGEVMRSKGTIPKLWSVEYFTWICCMMRNNPKSI